MRESVEGDDGGKGRAGRQANNVDGHSHSPSFSFYFLFLEVVVFYSIYIFSFLVALNNNLFSVSYFNEYIVLALFMVTKK